MAKAPSEQNVIQLSPAAPPRVWHYALLILWMIFISFASTAEFSSVNTSRFIGPFLLWLFPGLSDSQMGAIHFLMRKAGHFSEYAVLAFLARRAFATSTSKFIRHRWFELGLLLVTCYALLDEFHQSFVPTRTASIYDCAIDVMGGLTVLLIFKLSALHFTDRKVRPLNRN
ncbi:MAG TPA: VanZ family protein [Pyrinomonadaceae bacterium]|nr:VanZ family protein [Pyrinomonadaceae bacterium]